MHLRILKWLSVWLEIKILQVYTGGLNWGFGGGGA